MTYAQFSSIVLVLSYFLWEVTRAVFVRRLRVYAAPVWEQLGHPRGLLSRTVIFDSRNVEKYVLSRAHLKLSSHSARRAGSYFLVSQLIGLLAILNFVVSLVWYWLNMTWIG